MKIGRVTLCEEISSSGLRTDKYGEEIESLIALTFEEPTEFVRVIIPPDANQLRAALLRLCDEEKCPLIFTTGGTAVGKRDIIPEATLQVVDRELPGFGEVMRYYSFERVRTAIVSRATAGTRGGSLIVNLPTRPRAVQFCLKLVREGIAEALEQLTGKQTVLYVNPIEIPLEKWLPFLKWLRPKLDPRDLKAPSQ